jgi:hypothetical protein
MGAEATQMSAATAAAAHAICLAGLAAAHSLAGPNALVSDPALTLRLLVVRFGFVPLLTLPLLLPTVVSSDRCFSLLGL